MSNDIYVTKNMILCCWPPVHERDNVIEHITSCIMPYNVRKPCVHLYVLCSILFCARKKYYSIITHHVVFAWKDHMTCIVTYHSVNIYILCIHSLTIIIRIYICIYYVNIQHQLITYIHSSISYAFIARKTAPTILSHCSSLWPIELPGHCLQPSSCTAKVKRPEIMGLVYLPPEKLDFDG